MIPLVVLVAVTLATRAAGAAGVDLFNDWTAAIRVGLAAMLIMTATAHFGSRRVDLVRMVPPQLPQPELLVTVTGVAEVLLAAGLAADATARGAALALVTLLVAMFPANVHAARAGVGIGGRRPTPLTPRALMQMVFIAAAAAVYFGGS